jgi:DNA-binding GntR family transcriptional regulator
VDTRELVLAPPENRALAVVIAARLRQAILAGHFGPGEQLREEPIARSMEVSRGPVREAFVRLEREGLVVIRRNRGAFVARLAREDLDEVYTLRLAVERLAVERATRLADSDAIAGMQAVVDAMAASDPREVSVPTATELDLRLHDLIYRAALHRRLYESWANLRPQIHIMLLNRNVAHEDFRTHLVKDHQEILDAIRDRDAARAIRLLEAHLRLAYDRVLESYNRREERVAADGRGRQAGSR